MCELGVSRAGQTICSKQHTRKWAAGSVKTEVKFQSAFYGAIKIKETASSLIKVGKAAALSVQHEQPLISFCLSLGGRNVVIAFLFPSSYENMCLLVSTGMLPRAELTPAYASQPDLRTSNSTDQIGMW